MSRPRPRPPRSRASWRPPATAPRRNRRRPRTRPRKHARRRSMPTRRPATSSRPAPPPDAAAVEEFRDDQGGAQGPDQGRPEGRQAPAGRRSSGTGGRKADEVRTAWALLAAHRQQKATPRSRLFCAPGRRANLEVQVLPRADHSERSEAQLREATEPVKGKKRGAQTVSRGARTASEAAPAKASRQGTAKLSSPKGQAT